MHFENMCTFTLNLVAAELSLDLVNHFNCFKSYDVFDYVDAENSYNNRYKCLKVGLKFHKPLRNLI